MVIIKIKGRNCPGYKAEHVKRYVDWFIDQCMTKWYRKTAPATLNLNIEIEFRSLTGTGNDAYVENLDQRKEGPPRRFRIVVDSKHRMELALTFLGHELTHVKQYAWGEMREVGPALTIWHDEEFEIPSDPNCDEYHEWPWEVDAWGRQRVIGLYLSRHKIQLREGWFEEECEEHAAKSIRKVAKRSKVSSENGQKQEAI